MAYTSLHYGILVKYVSLNSGLVIHLKIGTADTAKSTSKVASVTIIPSQVYYVYCTQ